MPVYEKITKEVSRPSLTAGELRLHYDLRSEFCSAAWEALDAPVEIAKVCQNQTKPLNVLAGERHILELTEPLKKVFADIVFNAVSREAKRIGAEFPEELFDANNVDRLVAGCIERDHAAVPVFYKSYSPFDRD